MTIRDDERANLIAAWDKAVYDDNHGALLHAGERLSGALSQRPSSVMSEPIREQLAKVAAVALDSTVADADRPITAEESLAYWGDSAFAVADAVIAAFPVPSEVGEVETKLPLDPEPWVCTKPWHSDERYRSEVASRYRHFAPRPSYSQNREDYR